MPRRLREEGGAWARNRVPRMPSSFIVALLMLTMPELIAAEFSTSGLEAVLFSAAAKELSFRPQPGPSTSIRFPHSGPYDQRLGYEQLPAFISQLRAAGYVIGDQATISPALAEIDHLGFFTTYHEKSSAGLEVLDADGRSLYSARYPQRVYADFNAVPPLLAQSLLFIEDRHLLDADRPMRNPALDAGRFADAVVDEFQHFVNPAHAGSGGSTLATQIEKFRHSPGGRTVSVAEKFRQMASASLRAYADGPDTLAARRRIVVDYLNSVPLGAKPGYGEIQGIGDALLAWYGRDFDEVNRLLSADAPTTADSLRRRAVAFKQCLSLLVAERRPAYLSSGTKALRRLTDSYLQSLAAAGVISPALRDAALGVAIEPDPSPATPVRAVSFVDSKAASALRRNLAELLGQSRRYDLDRLDLQVSSTLDGRAQKGAAQIIRRIADPAEAARMGLFGEHLFRAGDATGGVSFSVSLFERTADADLMRVQTDNIDQPFDLNEGARLDLGSTAKLRTLVTYLEVILDLYRNYGAMSAAELAKLRPDPSDALSRWALRYLAAMPPDQRKLADMLDAAMARRYRASPVEVFFTGGSAHRFHNFEAKEDGRDYSVAQAFQHSVNLAFVRLMRDVVYYYENAATGGVGKLLDDSDAPPRRGYLERFADYEGSEFLERFYHEFADVGSADAEGELLARIHQPRRAAVAFRAIEPYADPERFEKFMRAAFPNSPASVDVLLDLYERSDVSRLGLADKAYLAGVHPLRLWLATYLRHRPAATLAEVLAAGRQACRDAYTWLYDSREKSEQDLRIRTMLERDAFAVIAADWRRQGYPFATLTPSYATAIGASGDRPAALAELMGILLNGGYRKPLVRIDSLRFAADTPFETRLDYRPPKPRLVIPAAVAEEVRRAMMLVVQGGTANRLQGAFRAADGTELAVGGKTGTGDHRYDVFAPGGRMIESRVVNRAATFVFFIGERYYGTVTAYVPAPEAARYHFSSALAVQVLKQLQPVIAPMLASGHGAA
jgi:membrane peptidoglycan carboxypeptidase